MSYAQAVEVSYPTEARSPTRIEGPLTTEIMSTLDVAQTSASEIAHRLYQLRDRLTGSPPADPTAHGNKADHPHFKAAHADRSAALLATLAEIDQISIDLANRL